MKKLTFGIVLGLIVVLSGCKQEFKDIKPVSQEGVKFEIDSSQWTPALIKVDRDKVLVYESEEIRKIYVVDLGDTFLLFLYSGLGIMAVTDRD